MSNVWRTESSLLSSYIHSGNWNCGMRPHRSGCKHGYSIDSNSHRIHTLIRVDCKNTCPPPTDSGDGACVVCGRVVASLPSPAILLRCDVTSFVILVSPAETTCHHASFSPVRERERDHQPIIRQRHRGSHLLCQVDVMLTEDSTSRLLLLLGSGCSRSQSFVSFKFPDRQTHRRCLPLQLLSLDAR